MLLDVFQPVAGFIDSVGRWKETLQIERFVLERIQLRHGIDHPSTVSAMSDLAATLGKQGQLEAAASMKQEV